MKNFTNLYSLQKTLRFELIPQGKTIDFIQKNNLLEQDYKRSENYKRVKKIINDYHKDFITAALRNIKLEHIAEFEILYFKKDRTETDSKELENYQKMMRKTIVNQFSKNENIEIANKYNNIFKQELIKEDLPYYTSNEDDKLLIEDFKNFTTYFVGFHKNRKNMYSEDDKSTGIAYRLIHDNLPKFLSNKRIFDKLKTSFPEIILEAKGEIEPYLNGVIFEDMFTHDYFSNTLTQPQIDLYNLMIGGKTQEDGNKIKGFNEVINLFRQKNSLNKRDIPNLSVLYKQILSDRYSASWVLDEIENDQELLDSIYQFYNEEILDFNKENILNKLKNLFKDIQQFHLDLIFIQNDKQLTDLSQAIFDDWSIITKALSKKYELNNPKIANSKKSNEKIKEHFEKTKYISIQEIENALSEYAIDNDTLNKKNIPFNNTIFDYLNKWELKRENNQYHLFDHLDMQYQNFLAIYNQRIDNKKKLNQDSNTVEIIKSFLDAIMDIIHYIKPLNAQKYEGEKDESFYGEFQAIYDQLNKTIQLYNKTRNYLTKKPYSVEKYKLNFDNSTLLNGWDVNKESANASIILKKKDSYYLAIMDKKHNYVFKETPKSSSDQYFQKVNYKLLPGASKMLPKVFFSAKNKSYYNPNENVLRIRNHGTHTKNGKAQNNYEKLDFNIEDCRYMIDFYKDSIEKHEDWKNFNFKFKKTNDYNSIDEFYSEVEEQGYYINYTDIDASYVNQLVEEGKIYLFQIYNKDFSEYSKGTPNLHTIYWKMLFDSENLKNVVYKLNGEAEIFYRKKSISYSKEILEKGHHYENLKEKFNYPIISNKRFTKEHHFQFHVPITINFKSQGLKNINHIAYDYMREEKALKIIGIDRGERHLLYLTMIDNQGNIIEQYSLNEIVNEYKGNAYKTNYHKLLSEKEEKRDKARKSWQTIENIKELKEGYISQVVHKIADMVIQHKAIVVLEDLNFGFKRGRFKVEKQVYQKFEKMLIDKFNYLIDKKRGVNEFGSALQALQLANKFDSFKNMGKQSGIIFYVPAWNTSKIDPVTGFVNMFYTQYENIENSQKFFSLFADIRWNEASDYFEFKISDYSKFNPKAADTKQEWTICTYGDRIHNFRNPKKNNQWDNQSVHLTQDFKQLFNEYHIDFHQELQGQIVSQNEKDFFERLLKLFKLTLQMRNSISNTEEDYIISPVCNALGESYDSRNQLPHLPKDADANGAYNIARKGLILLDKIKQNTDNKKLKLEISNKDWLQFAQK